MISKSLAIKVLNAALATGGDYAEIYCEESTSQSIRLENGKVETCTGGQTFGCGIRIFQNFRCVYGYTSDLSAKSLTNLATSLAASFEGERKITVESITKQRVKVVNKIKDHLLDVPVEEKIAYLKQAHEITQAVDPRIIRIIDDFSCSLRNWTLFNAEGSEGKQFVNQEERGRVAYVAFASDGQQIQLGSLNAGRCDGWHYFTDVIDWKGKAKKVGETAVAMLSAEECPSGKYTVVIANGWGGVLFHESCGHPLEASATARGLSIFTGAIGTQIASPIVSAIDDGTLANEWGSNNVDSEGVATHKNQLIKDGICVGFMVDKLNGRRLGMEPNGVCRRQSYKWLPTSRMSNTYICAGKDKPEDIIKDTPLGIYVANFGGGSVDPSTGEFNFSASEAYIIRDGKLAEMVKGCTLIGQGAEILHQIDRVGNDLDLGQGYCGASSGSIPVNVGQPTIRLKEITVGGRGGKLQ